MIWLLLSVIASSHIFFATAGKGNDPFKPSGDDWLNEAEDLVKQINSDPVDKEQPLEVKKSENEQQLDHILDNLQIDAGGLESKAVHGIADAIKGGEDENVENKHLPSLSTVDYKHDPRHRNDPLKDPNADKVLNELGLSEEEKQMMKHEKRQETTVDIAIKSCTAETSEHGCSDNDSPIRCLAQAVRQKAADISEKCRVKTEKALPYACSVELFITHCDGVEKPLIQCLDDNHPKLGPECLDVLTVTKKVLKTLKKPKKHEEPQFDSVYSPPIRHQRPEESSGPGFMTIGLVITAIALAVYFKQGGTVQDLQFKSQTLMRMISQIVGANGVATPTKGQKRSSPSHDWTSVVEDKDKDEKVVKLNNFGGYGGLG